ncbi:MAG: hypothetical protein K940chlam3_01738 [Chlamydiae bacterium]|nr:hypothetical protein [Chlamydiota bacterium]
MSAAEKQPEEFDHEVMNRDNGNIPIQDVTNILSKLSPEELAKFKLIDHKFKKIVEKVQAQKESECMSALKKIAGIGENKKNGMMTKIYETCTSLLLGKKGREKSHLKICSPHVTHMNLSVDPEAIENPDPILVELSHHCKSVEDLNLNSCNVSAKGIHTLENLDHLKSLSLCFCDEMTEDVILELVHLKQLKELKLCWNRSLPLESLHVLKELPQLETLDISHSNITDQVLTYINKMENLISLNCDESQELTDKGIETLTYLKHLKTLSISSPKITEKGLKTIITQFPELISLTLRNQNFSDEALSELKQLTQLTHLNLSWSHQLTGSLIDSLAELPNLQILDLSHCENLHPISNRWRDFKTLMVLDLIYSHVDDDVLEEVALIPMLSNAAFSYTDTITLKGVRHLVRLGHLRFLDLIYCGLDEEEVRPLFPETLELRI